MAPGGADPCHDGGPGALFHCPVTAPGFLGVTRTDSATYVVTARGGRGHSRPSVGGVPTGEKNCHDCSLPSAVPRYGIQYSER